MFNLDQSYHMTRAVFVHTESIFNLSNFAFGRPEESWFRQPDVQDYFSGVLRKTNDDMVCIYEESEAYPATVYLSTKLISKGASANELKRSGWSGFPKETRKMYCPNREKFLSRAFCDFASLEWCWFPQSPPTGFAYADREGKPAATRFVSKGPYGHSDLIFIKRSLLHSYIERFDCRLMTYLRINRYSERHLKEWGIKNRSRIHLSDSSFHYELEFCKNEQARRPLCPSCSFTIGKRDITDDIVASAITHKC